MRAMEIIVEECDADSYSSFFPRLQHTVRRKDHLVSMWPATKEGKELCGESRFNRHCLEPGLSLPLTSVASWTREGNASAKAQETEGWRPASGRST